MKGRVAAWFQWAIRNHLLPSASIFLDVVHHRFEPTQYEDVEGDLSKLSQCGSVANFKAQFEDLMNKVIGISKPSASLLLD
jgi:DNA gyrase inhibitor GyrI